MKTITRWTTPGFQAGKPENNLFEIVFPKLFEICNLKVKQQVSTLVIVLLADLIPSPVAHNLQFWDHAEQNVTWGSLGAVLSWLWLTSKTFQNISDSSRETRQPSTQARRCRGVQKPRGRTKTKPRFLFQRIRNPQAKCHKMMQHWKCPPAASASQSNCKALVSSPVSSNAANSARKVTSPLELRNCKGCSGCLNAFKMFKD